MHNGRLFSEDMSLHGPLGCQVSITNTFKHSRVAEGMFLSSLSRRAGYFILSLAAVDVFFIGADTMIHGLKFFELGDDWSFYNKFGVEAEGGFAEVFNYVQLSIVVAVLGAAFLRTRILPCLIIAVCFAFAGLDDSLELHETAGTLLELRLGLSPLAGLSAASVGQLLYFAVVGGVFSLVFVVGWRFADGDGRRVLLVFVPIFFALAFFAVVVDGLRDTSSNTVILHNVVGILEDGGEMLVVTVACGVALGIFRHFGRHSSKKVQYAP